MRWFEIIPGCFKFQNFRMIHSSQKEAQQALFVKFLPES